MRLLHITGNALGDEPLNITFSEFLGSEVPPYIILSHRWREEEVLFADMVGPDRIAARSRKGYTKLETTCRTALKMKHRYVWTDTCCIDKSSSAELSEAINSMYRYYAEAECCIAYLDDVEHDTGDDNLFTHTTRFSRGWTLQELIAPSRLIFYSKSWVEIGTRSDWSRHVSIASGIAISVLEDRDKLDGICISEKMSWAARRVTTRPEDEAYSLMGLFGVNMATLYGEGRENAFRRLQLEIMQVTSDHTLFAWDADVVTGNMLAPSVSCFLHGADYEPKDNTSRIVKGEAEQLKPDYAMTNVGLHIQLPISKISSGIHFACLACQYKNDAVHVAICLRKRSVVRFPSYARLAFDGHTVFRVQLWLLRTPCLIYISKASNPGFRVPQAWPVSRNFRFELRVKGSTAYPQIRYSQQSTNPPTSLSATRVPPYVQIDPSKQPEGFRSSKLPLQHLIQGYMPTRQFSHEVITLYDPRIRRSEEVLSIAFGDAVNSIWFDAEARPAIRGWEDAVYRQIYDGFAFPFGDYWVQGKLNDTVLLSPSKSYLKKSIGCRDRWDVEAVVDNEDDAAKVWLRIFVVRVPAKRFPASIFL